MAPSADQFDKHSSAIAARRSGNTEYQRLDYFSIQDGQVARIRFLEQGEDLRWASVHRIKATGMQWPQDVLCLDQNDDGTKCPACYSDNKEVRSRSTKGYINIIWRGSEESEYLRAPLYKKNEKGFVEKNINGQKITVGFEDSVWLWKCSKTVYEQILSKDKSYKGLMSRDFLVARKGAGLENTAYFIEPAVVDGGVEPMTVADQNLAENKFDVVKLTTPGTYEEMVHLLSGQSSVANGPQGTFNIEPTQENVFNTGSPMRSSAFQR